MAKTDSKKVHYICSECKNEFEGDGTCPECGNKAANLKLAPDGIEQDLHKGTFLFKLAPDQLKSAEDILMSTPPLEKKRARMQMEEMDDNLRESYVLKSKIKLHDLEMEKKRKELEARKLDEASEEYLSGKSSAAPPAVYPQADAAERPQYPQFPPMSQMSPQAVFMQQLMKMDGKKRAEFIEQLSEADPGALANLSAMFPQQQPQYPQYTASNPYGQYQVPPWMAQLQHQPQDSVALATSLVTTIFDLTQKAVPRQDDSIKDALRDFKSAIEKVHDRIDSLSVNNRDKDTSALAEAVRNLELKVSGGGHRQSIATQIGELTTLVNELEKVGMVARPGAATKSVDDELKLKEFEFKRETKEKELETETRKMEAEQAKANLNQNIVSSLLQRGIQKGLQARDEAHEQTHEAAPARITRIKTVPPVEVISEFATDGGVVRETRRPVKKIESGSEGQG